ncbi:TetR/AcrR family transcriptional regulator [Janibacter hoylei]|uniref:helix-turn-helix domain-containing protein n=1 Tax=Janibacter hoylei TaxID=364298 RepID=UPI0022375B0E|nr:helix-turn-helix domain-containing protein [Janibacter hoylei]MCW4601325.1 TetR/AcrR family transcriptional regulator [Janibacter hoylei]
MPPTRRTRQQPLSHGRIVATALGLLTRVGLPDLTMRAIGTELGVQQSALYHHFANKQTLLGAVADAILARRPALDATDLEPLAGGRASALPGPARGRHRLPGRR